MSSCREGTQRDATIVPPTETLQKVKVALGVDLQGLNVCSAFAALRRAESLRLEGLNGGRVLPAVGNAAGRPRLLSYNRQTTKQSAFSFFSLSRYPWQKTNHHVRPRAEGRERGGQI